ncbi:MAG: hypothetical protein ABJC74_09765 [Gemmatimonadota bacterium]
MNPAPAIAAAPDSLHWSDVIIIGGGCYGSFYVKQLERAAEQGRVSYSRLLVVDRYANCQAVRELAPRADREIVVEDWGIFLDEYLGAAAERLPSVRPSDSPLVRPSDVFPINPAAPQPRLPSQIVPSPLMPHLMYQWLVRRARERWPRRLVETRPVTSGPGTPYDVAAPDGTRYVSFADWLCPTHCTEPALCPVIKGPRTWEMSEALQRLAARHHAEGIAAEPVLFACQHQVFGVGTFGVDDVLRGDRQVLAAGAGGAAVDLLVGTISSCHGAASRLHLGSA